MPLYTSEIAASSLGVLPEGTPYIGTPCVCAMCRRPIVEGDLAVENNAISKTFTDYPHLTPTGAANLYVCGFCTATTSQSRNRYLQRSVITPDGNYSLNTDANRAWFWLTPPEPPYAVVVNHSTLGCFHYHWRTPVTLDNRRIWMNWDGDIHQVRRDRVVAAIGQAARLVEATNHKRMKNLVKSPFLQVNRAGMGARMNEHGRFQQLVLVTVDANPKLQADFDALASLSPGELLAASCFIKAVPAEPEAPPLVKGMPDRSKLAKDGDGDEALAGEAALAG